MRVGAEARNVPHHRPSQSTTVPFPIHISDPIYHPPSSLLTYWLNWKESRYRHQNTMLYCLQSLCHLEYSIGASRSTLWFKEEAKGFPPIRTLCDRCVERIGTRNGTSRTVSGNYYHAIHLGHLD
jgi:hypothetical protein